MDLPGFGIDEKERTFVPASKVISEARVSFPVPHFCFIHRQYPVHVFYARELNGRAIHVSRKIILMPLLLIDTLQILN